MKLGRFTKMVVLCVSLFVSATVVNAQTKVSGMVTDDEGSPVAGATVLVSGTMNGTQTNFEGYYSLWVDDADMAELEFSCLGFKSVNEVVRNRAVINVVMSEDSELLDEVVLVGYGTQKKVNLTGAVSSINFADVSETRTITNVSAALAGLAPGMMVRSTDATPGTESTTIRIRGTGSFTSSASSPLVLVDGVEWDIDRLNPNDIESISVLKDAASTAIYGSRAANGVILVSTKQGEVGKASVSYSFKGIWQTPYNPLEWVTNSADYMELINEAFENHTGSAPYSQETINTWREKAKDPYGKNEYGMYNYQAYPNTDWWDVLFDTGFSQEHNINVSGGTQTVRYMISGSYLENNGVMTHNSDNIDSSSRKVTFRTNVEADVTKWATVGTKIYAQYVNRGTGEVSEALNGSKTASPRTYPGEDGAWGYPDGGNGYNPMSQLAATGGARNTWRVNGTLFAKVRPYKGISLEANFNYSPSFFYNHTYDKQITQIDYNTGVVAKNSALDDATVTDYHSDNFYLSTDLLARYDATFKKDHTLGVILGYSTTQYQNRSFQVKQKGATDWMLNDGGTYAGTSGTSFTAPNGWGLRAYFARVNYAFKDRYLFEGNIRADGSSVFGSNNRWGYFPSFSAGWKIHEEPWMASASDWLSQLKLRASWGESGNNQGIGNYDWQATYTSGQLNIDASNSTGLYIASQSNYDLKWETTATTDVGLDLGFFNNRLTAELDYYYKKTWDILYTPSSYMVMGYLDQVPANLGSMWNQGTEISVTWKDTKGKFSYYVTANFAYNKNKVTSFKGALENTYYNGTYGTYFENNLSDVGESWGSGYLVEGHEIGEMYMYQLYHGTGKGYSGSGAVDPNAGPKDGMIRTQTDFEWLEAMLAAGYTFDGRSSTSKDNLWYGDFIYADLNGDGQYGNTYDRRFTGKSSTPHYNLGINFGFSWKGLDFSMLWTGAFDFDIFWCEQYWNMEKVTMGGSIPKHIADDHYFYDPANPSDPRTNQNGKYPRLYSDDAINTASSDFYCYKGDYMKLKNVTLGYTLPEKWTRKWFVKQLRFFVSGDNLLTITSYPGMDPEIGSSINYPLMRQYTVGAQITF